MKLAVVVGGQFGGEGKGKITAHLCRYHGFDAAVRCGGPNSGHTIYINNNRIVLRQIPAGVVNPNTKLFISAGCILDPDVLLKEIETFNLNPDRLRIDKNAVIIEEQDIKGEKRARLGDKIGSTCSGTGYAVVKRILRNEKTMLARDLPKLAPYIGNVSDEVMQYYKSKKKIIIEGTQGFGLSVYHSPYYPYATSRDTCASGFLSEVGISPLIVSDIIMVIRTFPIRVGGNSGPLPEEIDWNIIQDESGYPYKIEERTTVTNRLRRVGRFDLRIIIKAITANKPNHIALMGTDYLDFNNKGLRNYIKLTNNTKHFAAWLEKETGAKIDFIGTGPTDEEIIDILDVSQNDAQGEIINERF